MADIQQKKHTKIKTTQDWHNLIASGKRFDPFKLRKSCYENIEKYRNRPLLVYATKFIDDISLDTDIDTQNFIDLSDVDGFNDLIKSVKDNDTIDILLHSPGGMPDATERIVELLRGQFKNIDFLIPHSAYSAATMLALSGDHIILHPSAVLGPIDPQINGVPSRAIKNGIERVKRTILNEGPEVLPVYLPLIEKYSLELLELCNDSEKLSKLLVSEWLKKYMLKDEKNAESKIKKVVKYLSDYDKHLIHSRPLSINKLNQLKLKISLADNLLQDLLWEAHILINGFFNITPFVKLYENTKGISWGIQEETMP